MILSLQRESKISLLSVLLSIFILLIMVGCDDSTTDPQPAVEEVQFSMTNHDFGNVAVGEDADVTLTITNKTFGDITITNVDDDHVEVAVFTTDFNNLLPVTVASDATRNIKIKFAPEAAQSYTAKLTVQTDNEDFASTEISLAGKGADTVPTTWDNYIGSFLGNKCTPCHISASSGGYNISTFANAMLGNRITPNNAEESSLVHRIEGTSGIRMPQGGPYLSEEEIGVIKAWIDDGAPEN
ncbi:MAG: hypothetical protein HN356_08425 [Calditrichaeota bacterium]|nr:hypothetical protein [Calditrichota bacterium]MBT6614550.1 hypothetical protein [Deltaproteobacteria bacterium]MBT7617164.1 hypothetical protein [Calditrichota bacterium]